MVVRICWDCIVFWWRVCVFVCSCVWGSWVWLGKVGDVCVKNYIYVCVVWFWWCWLCCGWLALCVLVWIIGLVGWYWFVVLCGCVCVFGCRSSLVGCFVLDFGRLVFDIVWLFVGVGCLGFWGWRWFWGGCVCWWCVGWFFFFCYLGCCRLVVVCCLLDCLVGCVVKCCWCVWVCFGLLLVYWVVCLWVWLCCLAVFVCGCLKNCCFCVVVWWWRLGFGWCWNGFLVCFWVRVWLLVVLLWYIVCCWWEWRNWRRINIVVRLCVDVGIVVGLFVWWLVWIVLRRLGVVVDNWRVCLVCCCFVVVGLWRWFWNLDW